MSRERVEADIVRKLARQVCQRLTRRTIAKLQSMSDEVMLLSGDDTLRNTWDEICVQVQFEESVHWEVYGETVQVILDGAVKELPRDELVAVWLQTPEGEKWEDDDDESTIIDCPASDDGVAEYIRTEYVYAEAENWTNARIRAYLDRVTSTD